MAGLSEYYGFTDTEFKLKETKVDLTKIDKPFGKLDRKTQVTLFEYWLDGGVIIYRHPYTYKMHVVSEPSWSMGYIYKAKEPTKKMTVKEVCSALGYDVEIVKES